MGINEAIYAARPAGAAWSSLNDLLTRYVSEQNLLERVMLPERQTGAVILTNADNGVDIRGPLQRRLLEVLFDGRPIAAASVTSSAKSVKAEVLAERKRLTVPADTSEAAKLAAMYRNASLGHIDVSHAAGKTNFDFGAWQSEVASRKNDDGSLSFVTISPGEEGLDFVVTNNNKGQGLVLRDGQHEYQYAGAK